jgi:hypothetical protein
VIAARILREALSPFQIWGPPSIIDDQVAVTGGQNRFCHLTYTVFSRKSPSRAPLTLRIQIRYDTSYVEQGSAKIHRWHEEHGWQLVGEIMGSHLTEATTDEFLRRRKTAERLTNELFVEAAMIDDVRRLHGIAWSTIEYPIV